MEIKREGERFLRGERELRRWVKAVEKKRVEEEGRRKRKEIKK